MKLKTALTVFTIALLSVLTGCNGTAGEEELLSREKELLRRGRRLLIVDFQKGQSLRYKFVSSRDIKVDWAPTERPGPGKKSRVNKSSESMEMVVAYMPIEIDRYGLATIRATCESVFVRRSPHKVRNIIRKDAAKSFAGKSFTFTVSPTGKIEDYSQLEKLIMEVGEKAFRPNTGGGRIKEPDMIGDFITTQWFLWDSISSIEKPIQGVRLHQTWKSRLPVPLPMVLQKARDVTYTFDEIRRSQNGQIAVIRSSYSLAESVPSDWPMPYSGSFQVAGRFGFLRGYKVLDLQGQGEELFDIDAGRIKRYNQQYRIQFEAFLPIKLDVNPRITIEQKLTMQLLE